MANAHVLVRSREIVWVENEKDYVRVLPTRSGNNGGNKMKLRQ